MWQPRTREPLENSSLLNRSLYFCGVCPYDCNQKQQLIQTLAHVTPHSRIKHTSSTDRYTPWCRCSVWCARKKTINLFLTGLKWALIFITKYKTCFWSTFSHFNQRCQFSVSASDTRNIWWCFYFCLVMWNGAETTACVAFRRTQHQHWVFQQLNSEYNKKDIGMLASAIVGRGFEPPAWGIKELKQLITIPLMLQETVL